MSAAKKIEEIQIGYMVPVYRTWVPEDFVDEEEWEAFIKLVKEDRNEAIEHFYDSIEGFYVDEFANNEHEIEIKFINK